MVCTLLYGQDFVSRGVFYVIRELVFGIRARSWLVKYL